jgi:uncharacterized protein (DUF1684 family)
VTTAEEHHQWHQERLSALCAPDGWLTLVDLIWLDSGTYQTGTDPQCQIVVPEARLRGSLRIDGGAACWQPQNGPAVTLETDRHGNPTVIRAGSHSFFLIERDGQLGLRVRNTEAPTRTGFRGIELYPLDPHWQLSARLTTDSDGTVAHFTIDETTYSLRPLDSSAESLQFVFSDLTNGRETYGGGRFLYAKKCDSGTLQLDFNRAINPPCAFTPFAVCPLPPPENRLPLRITAGEKTLSHIR